MEELPVWEGTGAQEQPQWGEELPVWEGLSAWVEPNLLAGLSRCSLWGYPVMFPSSFWAHHKTISQPFVLWGHVTESWPMEYGINDACHSQAWSITISPLMAHLHSFFCREVESSLEYTGSIRHRRCLGPCVTALRDPPQPQQLHWTRTEVWTPWPAGQSGRTTCF